MAVRVAGSGVWLGSLPTSALAKAVDPASSSEGGSVGPELALSVGSGLGSAGAVAVGRSGRGVRVGVAVASAANPPPLPPQAAKPHADTATSNPSTSHSFFDLTGTRRPYRSGSHA